uniref:Ribosomal RNA-processing protein 14/surfeit locus protein 6 C-terminal domain-containing protein n=1 Tax=Arcella intermedia TaxID=1963864 RepID=A0A6B2LG78_9EUKA
MKRRLREKLNALRAKRNAPPLGDENEGSLEPPKKRVKTEKSKKKEKRKKKHKPGTPTPQTQPQGQSSQSQQTPQQAQKPQQQNDIEYGKFDIGSTGPVPTYLTKRKPSKTALLKQAQEKKQKLQALKGTEEGEALIKQEAWSTAKKKLIGEKVFDDPDRLKKSIKRDEQKKKKSKKEWDQRIRTQRNQQIASQRKREENIAAAKEKRKERKLGIKRKPSKRAGFEGEKKQVINK